MILGIFRYLYISYGINDILHDYLQENSEDLLKLFDSSYKGLKEF